MKNNISKEELLENIKNTRTVLQELKENQHLLNEEDKKQLDEMAELLEEMKPEKAV